MKNKKILHFINACFGLFTFCYLNNNFYQFDDVTIKNNKIPEAFEGYKIIHLSDIHNKKIPNYLIRKIKNKNPNIIVITGDLIDTYDMKNALILCKKLIKICPVYFITGNHDETYNCKCLLDNLDDIGINILNNKTKKIYHNNSFINLAGLKDGCNYEKELYKFNIDNNTFNVLLSHRPEKFEIYKNSNFDLILCGHAHGGQFRFPFIGGLYAPEQGILPKYTAGIISKNNKNMIISRGIGNSTFPLRLFNRPEIITINLSKKY